MDCTRRTFLTAASGLALGTRLPGASVQGANDRVRIGVIGTGGRARGLMTQPHLRNWMDCIRSRKTPNANIRVAHHAARTAHIANAALRAGRAVRWNDRAGRVES